MTADRAKLERLQTLFVRMLFCDRTVARYRDDPAGLAADYGLAPEALAELPDPDGRQMRAERHGRRTGVLREIRKSYQNAWPLLERREGFDFGDYLSSDEFYDPTAGLPHPFGIGQGYENSSKFFFWARRALGLDRPGADAQLRLMVMGDFASYLVTQYELGSHDFYARFAAGVYWRETPGTDLPMMYMTAERHVFRYSMETQHAELRRRGAVDLDALSPEGPARRENIR